MRVGVVESHEDPASVRPLSIVHVGGCIRRKERELGGRENPELKRGHQAPLIQLLLLVLVRRSCVSHV